eukprot:4575803-Prymnesium_polylepis.1
MLASFLRAFVDECRPHVKAAPMSVGDMLKAGLSTLGWSVSTNSSAAGSAPPLPEAVLAFLEKALATLSEPAPKAAVPEPVPTSPEKEFEARLEKDFEARLE